MSKRDDASELFARAVLEEKCPACRQGFLVTALRARCPNPTCAQYPMTGGRYFVALEHQAVCWCDMASGDVSARQRVFEPRAAAHPAIPFRVWFWSERP